ncbi:MAG: hypothetical protein WDO68_01020 [Gammaproteobacteria bacterium]
MNTPLDDELRKALRPVDPDEGFAERVMRRIDSTPAPLQRRPRWFPALPVALAASALLGTILIYAWHAEREQQRQGLEARRQLIEALHITGEKLDLAYRGVNGETRPPAPDDTGA